MRGQLRKKAEEKTDKRTPNYQTVDIITAEKLFYF